MRLRDLRRKIRLLETFLHMTYDRAILSRAASSLLVPVHGGKIRRSDVYTSLAVACGRAVSNQFIAEADAVLEALGGRKGNSHGYRSWRHIGWRCIN